MALPQSHLDDWQCAFLSFLEVYISARLLVDFLLPFRCLWLLVTSCQALLGMLLIQVRGYFLQAFLAFLVFLSEGDTFILIGEST